MSAVEHFTQARPRLLRLAYSELGDVGEAEDVVQERGCGWSAPTRTRSRTSAPG